MKRFTLIAISITLLSACSNDESSSDASGTFEAIETIVSADASGTIKTFSIEEGQELKAGETIGYIDSMQLYLKKEQLMAQITAVLGKRPNIGAQTAALQEQLKQAQREQKRIANLVQADAATRKQLDDANSQIGIIQKQIAAQESALGITSSSLSGETLPLSVQIQQMNDLLARCRLVNPIDGTVLVKYAEANEMTTTGKPLYKIADLSTLLLRAYVTGDQFAKIKLNQPVTVLIDGADGKYKKYKGTITWISDKAEFTPKTIQTKDERANLVYAIKIRVNNDGLLKIGMYGEVKF